MRMTKRKRGQRSSIISWTCDNRKHGYYEKLIKPFAPRWVSCELFIKINDLYSDPRTKHVSTLFLLRYIMFFQRRRRSCLKKSIAPRSYLTMMVSWKKKYSMRKSEKLHSSSGTLITLNYGLIGCSEQSKADKEHMWSTNFAEVIFKLSLPSKYKNIKECCPMTQQAVIVFLVSERLSRCPLWSAQDGQSSASSWNPPDPSSLPECGLCVSSRVICLRLRIMVCDRLQEVKLQGLE